MPGNFILVLIEPRWLRPNEDPVKSEVYDQELSVYEPRVFKWFRGSVSLHDRLTLGSYNNDLQMCAV